MKEDKICERCEEKEATNNPVTIFNPSEVKDAIPLCGRCMKEIAGIMAGIPMVALTLITDWVIQRDQEKQLTSLPPQD
jgi:hypothetical protein